MATSVLQPIVTSEKTKLFLTRKMQIRYFDPARLSPSEASALTDSAG